MSLRDKKLCRELDILLANRKYDEIISKITTRYNEEPLPLQVEKTLALAYFYKGDFGNSLKCFESIVSREENTENLFNVMISLLSLKKIEQAKEVFNKIIKTHRGVESTGKGKNFLPQLCIPYIRYYYACGLVDAGVYDEALIQLEELKKVFIDIKITDDTFLYLRGIPFFGSFIELAQKVFNGIKKKFDSSKFLNELLSNVDSDGKEIIKKICKTEF